MPNRFSNLYVNYYYGSKIKLNEQWGEKNVICPYSKIYYIIGGECRIIIEEKEYDARPGDFFLIPAGIKHSFFHTNNNFIQKYWFHFDVEAEATSIFNIIHPPYYCHITSGKHIISLFRSIFKHSNDNSASAQLLLNAKILELLSVYFEMTGTLFCDSIIDENSLLTTITEYITTNIHKNITLNELADIAHFHPNYFVRFFKERMGIPPAKYVNNIKIEHAKSMLENTNMSVREVMEAIGFNDYSHFSKFFKTHSGYSPSAFRNFYSKL